MYHVWYVNIYSVTNKQEPFIKVVVPVLKWMPLISDICSRMFYISDGIVEIFGVIRVTDCV
jgi:hypothetical protein